MKIVVTPRIFIEPPKLTEASLFVEWLNDPDLMKYSEQRHKKHTVLTQTDYWHSNATIAPNGVHTIYLARLEIPIGSIAYRVDPNNQIAELGILIGDRANRGKGYGLEAWKATCTFLFYTGIRKIEAGCMALNKPMISICEKSGMFLEGKRVEHFNVNGMLSNLLMYGRFPS